LSAEIVRHVGDESVIDVDLEKDRAGQIWSRAIFREERDNKTMHRSKWPS